MECSRPRYGTYCIPWNMSDCRRKRINDSVLACGPIRLHLCYGLPPPRTTHQSALRVLKTRSGRYFIGKATRQGPLSGFLKHLGFLLAEAKPQDPIGTPVRVTLHWVFERPKCRSKTQGLSPCQTKPDLDNACKTVLDTLTAARWVRDDVIVSTLVLHKSEAAEGYLEIWLQDDA